jgi:hypothetical protein
LAEFPVLAEHGGVGAGEGGSGRRGGGVGGGRGGGSGRFAGAGHGKWNLECRIQNAELKTKLGFKTDFETGLTGWTG